MMNTTLKIASALAVAGFLTACGGYDDDVVEVEANTPIYAKDGTIIGYEPTVGASGTSDDFNIDGKRDRGADLDQDVVDAPSGDDSDVDVD